MKIENALELYQMPVYLQKEEIMMDPRVLEIILCYLPVEDLVKVGTCNRHFHVLSVNPYYPTYKWLINSPVFLNGPFVDRREDRIFIKEECFEEIFELYIRYDFSQTKPHKKLHLSEIDHLILGYYKGDYLSIFTLYNKYEHGSEKDNIKQDVEMARRLLVPKAEEGKEIAISLLIGHLKKHQSSGQEIEEKARYFFLRGSAVGAYLFWDLIKIKGDEALKKEVLDLFEFAKDKSDYYRTLTYTLKIVHRTLKKEASVYCEKLKEYESQFSVSKKEQIKAERMWARKFMFLSYEEENFFKAFSYLLHFVREELMHDIKEKIVKIKTKK